VLFRSAFGNDAHHMTAPRPDGSQAARVMRHALRDADVKPNEIGYINAHGSSTPLNDSTETLAIKQVLGDRAYEISRCDWSSDVCSSDLIT